MYRTLNDPVANAVVSNAPMPNETASTRATQSEATERHRRCQSATVSVAITDINADESYLATFKVGTPAKEYQLVLDMGSSDFWMLGAQCWGGIESGTTTDFYDGTSSSTFDKSATQPFGEQYGSGAVNDTTATEIISVAGPHCRQAAVW